MASVFVKRVMVEYVSGGKLFRVQFDPAAIGSIVFNDTDRKRAQDKQSEVTGIAVVPSTFDTTQAIPLEMPAGQKTGVLTASAPVATAEAASGPPLWWHTNSCTWFHPDE